MSSIPVVENPCDMYSKYRITENIPLSDLETLCTAYRDGRVENQRIQMLQYQNLRSCFRELVRLVLGDNYYNMAMDVYTCDETCCRDIWEKVRPRGSERWSGIHKSQAEAALKGMEAGE